MGHRGPHLPRLQVSTDKVAPLCPARREPVPGPGPSRHQGASTEKGPALTLPLPGTQLLGLPAWIAWVTQKTQKSPASPSFWTLHTHTRPDCAVAGVWNCGAGLRMRRELCLPAGAEPPAIRKERRLPPAGHSGAAGGHQQALGALGFAENRGVVPAPAQAWTPPAEPLAADPLQQLDKSPASHGPWP